MTGITTNRLKILACLPVVLLFVLLGRYDAAAALLAGLGYLWWEAGRPGPGGK